MNETVSKRQRVRTYLAEQTRDGVLYCKNRQIATALVGEPELSSKEIDQAMLALSESASKLVIEPWGYTSATTWRVEQAQAEATASERTQSRSCEETQS